MSKNELIIDQSMPITARREIVRDNADNREITKYQKPLSTEELDSKRETLTENAIQLSILDDDLAEVKKEFKTKMDPLRSHNKVLLEQIKTKQETVEGPIYHFANHHTGFLETYDENGELLSTRKLRPEEKQGKLFVAKVAGE